MSEDEREELDDELELEGTLDPHEAEELRLQLQRLARRHGVTLDRLEIRPREPGPPSA